MNYTLLRRVFIKNKKAVNCFEKVNKDNLDNKSN